MKRIIFCLTLVFFTITSSAQSKFSFTLQNGIGQMKTFVHDPIPSISEIKTPISYSNQASFNYSYHLKHLFFETGINYNFIQGTQIESLVMNAINGLPAEIVSKTKTKAHYVGVPLTINHKINHFNYGLGASINYRITNSHFTEIEENRQLLALIGGGNNLSKLDYGLIAQGGYVLNDHISVRANFYYGLNDISNGSNPGVSNILFQGDPSDRSIKNRQFTIGLRYTL